MGRQLLAAPLVIGLLALATNGCDDFFQLGKEPHQAVKGPETWQISGRSYRDLVSYYDRGFNGSVSYVVDYPVPDEKALFGINDQSARLIAWPLLRYVWENHKHERKTIKPNRATSPALLRLAVNIFSAKRRDIPGYRVVVSIGEIVECIKRGALCRYPGEPH